MWHPSSALVVLLAAVFCAPSVWAQGPGTDRWRSPPRERNAADCRATYDRRMEQFHERVANFRIELDLNEAEIRAAADPEQRQALLEKRARLRLDLAAVAAEEERVEARNHADLRKCLRRIGSVRSSGSRPKKVIVTTPRSSGGRSVRGGATYGAQPVWVPGPRISAPPRVGPKLIAPPFGAAGGRVIRTPGGRGGCHHRPGSSQMHCGNG